MASLTHGVLTPSGTPPPCSPDSWVGLRLEKEQHWRKITESVALLCGYWRWGGHSLTPLSFTHPYPTCPCPRIEMRVSFLVEGMGNKSRAGFHGQGSHRWQLNQKCQGQREKLGGQSQAPTSYAFPVTGSPLSITKSK